MSSRGIVEKKVKRRKRGLFLLILIAIISLFVILVTKTDFFHIKEIQVTGNKRLNHDRIVLASGIMKGENILRIDKKIITENLLSHPYIKDVSIKRKLPKKVVINIKEREEIAVLKYMGSYIYVDNDGIVLSILSENEKPDLPIIEGFEIEDFTIGKKIKSKDNMDTSKFFNMISISKDLDIISTIKKIEIDENSQINVVLYDNLIFAFGGLDNVKYKLSSIKKMGEELEKRNIKTGTVYLNRGDNPIYTPEID
ncbi:cell division protein FtsQ/DivIB [Clostridiisalibacter paucivorans]|uniref:cell division protein FtsQ/DivIB n=1 Tax=Clostridiisalibacter paucivorans TaxID=408753 RepID=UPI00047D873B|nr:FtsQ-type POTRA domain-containing protein [Clostridiisalibacter paucivorans]